MHIFIIKNFTYYVTSVVLWRYFRCFMTSNLVITSVITLLSVCVYSGGRSIYDVVLLPHSWRLWSWSRHFLFQYDCYMLSLCSINDLLRYFPYGCCTLYLCRHVPVMTSRPLTWRNLTLTYRYYQYDFYTLFLCVRNVLLRHSNASSHPERPFPIHLYTSFDTSYPL